MQWFPTRDEEYVDLTVTVRTGMKLFRRVGGIGPGKERSGEDPRDSSGSIGTPTKVFVVGTHPWPHGRFKRQTASSARVLVQGSCDVH